MNTRKAFLAALLLLPLLLRAQNNDYTQFVNPFIGTQTDETGALSGSTFPGATMPQGMVQLSPETEQMVTWDPCSGYDYNKDVIYGFTHTHLSGTGCTDLIDVSLMPLTHMPTPELLKAADFGQHYSHDTESARPGYYQVALQESKVNVELSATVRTGIHRYTFQKGDPQFVVLDLDRGTYRGEAYYSGRRTYDVIQAQIRVVDDHTIEGYRVVTGWAKLRKIYFRAEFSKPIKEHLLMNGNLNIGKNSEVVNGRTLRAALRFDPSEGQQLMVKVAISPVDIEGARKNMKAEASRWDFDAYMQAAHDAWQKELSRIDIEGTDEQKTIFYTGLYHVLMQPNTMSDVDGRYMDTNFEIKQMPKGQVYHSTFSHWDTFRAAHPLYTLIAPDIAAQFVRDMVLHHQTYGYLPIWDLWGQDNYCMIGNHAIPVLADAIMAELPGINVEEAYQAMERGVKAGKIHSIGLSNFYEKDVDRMMKIATIKPAVLQNETHPYHQSRSVKNHIAKLGTILEAWFPLGGRGTGIQTLSRHSTITNIAKAHGKSAYQVLLRWHLQSGNIVIPGSKNAAHIAEDYNIFDFELTADEMKAINELECNHRFASY